MAMVVAMPPPTLSRNSQSATSLVNGRAERTCHTVRKLPTKALSRSAKGEFSTWITE